MSTPLLRALLFGAILLTATACGGTATSSPAASASASPAVPSAAASEAPSVTPTDPSSSSGGGGGPIAEATVAKLQADPFVAHVEQVATASAAGQDVSVAGSIDFSGDDVRALLKITSAGQTTEQEIVVIGEDAWVRDGADAEFVTFPTSVLGNTVQEMYKSVRLVDDPESLRFVGSETINGQELQHLTAVATIPYAPASGGTGQYDVFDLWVLEDGTPVFARTEFSATDSAGNDATGTTDFEFSNFGGPITIEPPVAGS